MPVRYFIPGVGVGVFDDGTSIEQAYAMAAERYGLPQDQGQQPDDSSTMGALGRGFVRGAAPAAAGLAAAAPGAEIGGAIGSVAGPIGTAAGALVGGAGAGLYAAYKASQLQQQAFADHPAVASALGQSPEQVQADTAEHPYASMVGEVAPNLLAFRPSLAALGRVGNAATPEAAAAIRAARINAGVNAAVAGGQEAGFEYYHTGEIDPTAVALQAGMGLLGQKETALGRAVMAPTRALIPSAIRDMNSRVFSQRPTVEENVQSGRPADLLRTASEDTPRRDLFEGMEPEQNPTMHGPPPPRPSTDVTAARADLDDLLAHRSQLTQSVAQAARQGDTQGFYTAQDALGAFDQQHYTPEVRAYEDQRLRQQAASADQQPDMLTNMPPDPNEVRRAAFYGAQEGAQGNLFDTHPDMPVPEAPAAQLAGQPATQLPDASQPGLFDRTPTATVRTEFGPKEILQRLQGSVGEAAVAKKMTGTSMDTPRPRDPYVYKVFTAVTKHLANDNVPALEGYIIDQRQELEHASIKPETIETRTRVLDAAQEIADEYRTKSLDAMAQEGVAKDQGAVEVGEQAPPPEASAPAIRERGAMAPDEARAALLDEALSKPNLRNPTKYFIARLKRSRLEPVLTEAEAMRLAEPRPEPKAEKRAEVRQRVEAAKKPRKTPPVQSKRPSESAEARPERAQEASKQVKEAKPAEKAPEPARTEPEGLDKARRLGDLSKSIDKALKAKQITAGDRLKLNNLVRNGAEPDVISQAIEDAKTARAGKIFGDAAKPAQTERLNAALPLISDTKGRVSMREVQGQLEKAAPSPADKRVLDHINQTLNRLSVGKWKFIPRIVDKMPEGFEGSRGLTIMHPDRGEIEILLDREHGTNYVTTTHELAHAATMVAIEASKHGFPTSPEMKAAVDGLNNVLARVHEHINGLSGAEMPAIVRQFLESKNNAFDDEHELLAWALTDPEAQEYLNTVPYSPEKTMWQRIVDAIRRVLGLRPDDTSALDEVLRVSKEIMDRAPTVEELHTQLEEEGFTPQLAERTAALKDAERNIEKLPSELRGAALAVTDTFRGKGSKVAAIMAFGPKLSEMAAKSGLKSAKTLQRLLNDRVGIQESVEQQYAALTERFDKLSAKLRGRGGDTVNGIVKDMVMGGKWAFEPSWLKDQTGAAVKVDVDPEMAARFNELPADARKILEDAFRLPHETLHATWDAVKAFVQGEHQAMIEAAQDRLDAASKAGEPAGTIAKLTEAVQEAKDGLAADMKRYHRLFDVNLNEPYAPIRRFGNYVVVARSPEFVAAEDEAHAAGRMDTLDDLKTDPNHYFVDFVESRAQAEATKRALTKQYGPDVEVFTRDKARQELFGGRDMLGAFQRVRTMVDEQVGSARERATLHKMISDLMLSTLASTSSRKAEMTRLKVAGGDFDMVRSVIQHGRGSARFIAALHKNSEILDTLRHLDQEAARPEGKRDPEGREQRENFKQEIIARYVRSLAPTPQNAIADKMTAVTSLYMLLTSPSFFIQQMSQPAVMSIPIAAAEHGYAKSWRHLFNGYGAVRDAWRGTSLTGQLKIEQLPEKWQPLAYYLAERGRLDIGISHDMGDWKSDGRGFAKDAVRKVFSRLGALTRKTEAINRLATGVMMYELKNGAKGDVPNLHDEGAYAAYLADFREAHPDLTPMTESQFVSAGHALKLIDETHGTYDIMNAPRFMRPAPARVILQFKKFQLMQLQLYAQNIHNGFFGKDISPAERAVARRALGFMLGHAAVVAGALGLPGAALIGTLYQTLAGIDGDENKRPDAERDLRTAIGDPALANLLLNGAPSLGGLNLTGSLGQGNVLSLAPYADTPMDQKTYDAYVTQLLGPMIGGIFRNMAGGLDLMSKGETWKGIEKMLPRGLMAASKSIREATTGETNSRGEVLSKDIPPEETFAGLLGLNTSSRSARQFNRDQAFKDEDFFKDRTADIRKQYIEAAAAKDARAQDKLRHDWLDLQAARAKAGYKRQPLSDLIRAPKERMKRERNTLGGVQYTRTSRGAVQQINDLTDVEDDEED